MGLGSEALEYRLWSNRSFLAGNHVGDPLRAIYGLPSFPSKPNA